ncbi:MAG: hypothetical protein VKJ64_07925 [Leptolyngbyaceae bacterium]|nr:hypothetical protein [Leptolyngbyaceae bacterium]
MKGNSPLTPDQTRQILFNTLARDWERPERDRLWAAVSTPELPGKQSSTAVQSDPSHNWPHSYLFYI